MPLRPAVPGWRIDEAEQLTINRRNNIMMVRIKVIILICLMAILSLSGQCYAQMKLDNTSMEKCRTAARGVEYCILDVKPDRGEMGGRLHILRIDPSLAKLKLLLASEHSNISRTAAEWCREFGLIAAINAGMYGKDLLTNVGYLQNGTYVQNKRWNKKYQSVLAFDARQPDRPPAIMIDLDEPEAIKKVQDYNAVIQNLRLIKGDGINVWGRSERRWSEAAVGMDRSGRILFIFCRSPYPMLVFNEMIRSSGLAVVRLMHMEGGPVASMSIRTKTISLDMSGSYETGLKPDDTNDMQWPIPNVIGVESK
jgi:hypothetical protein